MQPRATGTPKRGNCPRRAAQRLDLPNTNEGCAHQRSAANVDSVLTRREEPKMKHVLTLTIVALALTSTVAEAQGKRIHVTAEVVQQTFTGDLAHPQLGDQLISNVVLLDERHRQVGTGTGACTVVGVPPLDTRLQCVLGAAFAGGQIAFGGAAPLPEVGVEARFGIFGGTGDFRKARGEATLVVISPVLQEATFDFQ